MVRLQRDPHRRGDVALILRMLQLSMLVAMLALVALTAPLAAFAADVWVNTNSGVYHCPGTQYYGNTKVGTYLAESAAVTRGYRPAHNRACVPGEANSARQDLTQALAPAGSAADHKVWVNSGSHVYHCPGTRYYGATKRGYFASEGEAISSGNRPAYGARCN